MSPDPSAAKETPAASMSPIVIRRHVVRCANLDSLATLDSPFLLGPLDQLVAPFIPVAVVFVYKHPGSTSNLAVEHNELICVDRLRLALSILLNYYPHLTGRLQIHPEDDTLEIVHLGKGAEIHVAECAASLDAFSVLPDDTQPTNAYASNNRISLLKLPGAGNELLAPFDGSLQGVGLDPIFTIQHTRFACGGVALGASILHTVCDAVGFFQLMHDLAELYRECLASEKHGGKPDSSNVKLKCPPCIRSYLSRPCEMTPEARQRACQYQPVDFYLERECQQSSEVTTASCPSAGLPAPPLVAGRVLRFSGQELKALKAHAMNREDITNHDRRISTFEALSAHICQCVYRARVQYCAMQGDPQAALKLSTDFLTPINWRSRLHLPPHYFPNAVLCRITTFPSDILSNGSVGQLARTLHALIQARDAEQARHTLQWIAAQPDKSRIKLDFRYGNGSFMVSQWNKFDMYGGVDFDLDAQGNSIRPALVWPPFTPISLVDGLAYFLATEEQRRQDPERTNVPATAAIDVNLSLIEPLWAILESDPSFRRFRQ